MLNRHKPLSEPIYTPYMCLLATLCQSECNANVCGKTSCLKVFNSLRPSDAYMHQQTNHHWFKKWLAAWLAPSHYQNQCWDIVNWNLRNKFQWNHKQNSNIFIQENAFENVVWKMTAMLSWPQCVKHKRAIVLIGLFKGDIFPLSISFELNPWYVENVSVPLCWM